MYPFERFTEAAKQALTFAAEEAEAMAVSYIGTEHLLIGLARAQTPARNVLLEFGMDAISLRASALRFVKSGPTDPPLAIVPTARVKVAIELSFELARRIFSGIVDGEHLLLGIVIEGESAGAQILSDAGADLDAMCASLGVDVEKFRGVRPARSVSTMRAPAGEAAGVRVGDRVLVHDPAPPYRIREATVAEEADPDVTVLLADGGERERRAVPMDRLHAVPPQVMHCPYCEYRDRHVD